MHLTSFGDAGHYSIRCLLRCFKSIQQDCLHSIERCPFLKKLRKNNDKRNKDRLSLFRSDVRNSKLTKAKYTGWSTIRNVLCSEAYFVLSIILTYNSNIFNSHKDKQIYNEIYYILSYDKVSFLPFPNTLLKRRLLIKKRFVRFI